MIPFLLHLAIFSALACEHEMIGSTEIIRDTYATIVYVHHEDTIEIASIRTAEGHKGKGYGSWVFSKMIDRHPDLHAYEAHLMHDNHQAYLRAIGSCFERARETPIYKMGARIGFTNITVCDENESGVWVKIEKV